jgi:putative peptidoglycan lipid II flippase
MTGEPDVAPPTGWRPGRLAGSLTGAALLMALAIGLSRVVGFGRVLVFSKTVGSTCLGDAYNTANLLPNVAFEVVAGGALASVVVPLLVGPLARGDTEQAGAVLSALVTWTLAVLVPIGLLLALLAGPILGIFLDDKAACGPEAVHVGARMLRVFAPQVPMYGLAVVIGGALQARRSYLPSTAAPIVASVIVIPAYLIFAALGSGDAPLADLSSGAELALSLGTTLGVAGLTLATVLPATRPGYRLPLRLRFGFPAGVAARARALAAAGLAALLAQQGAALVVTWLANSRGTAGAFTLYTWAWQLYLLPYAVLAVPLATSAFQRLATAAETGDDRTYAQTAARSTRLVVIAGCCGAALLAAAAVPLARVFVLGPGASDVSALAAGLVAFAPGLLGYGLIAHVGRALYARHRGRQAAAATVTGWLAAIVADLVLVNVLPAGDVVAALGWGNSIGMTVAGTLLAVALKREAGSGALVGVPRSAAVAVVSALAAAAAGYLVGQRFADASFVSAVAGGFAAAAVAMALFAGVVAAADRGSIASLRPGRSASTPL